MADSECYEQRDPSKRLSCFYDKVREFSCIIIFLSVLKPCRERLFRYCLSFENLGLMFLKALVNVGADLAMLVPGRVSTEVDARLAYDTHAIIHKVLLKC